VDDCVVYGDVLVLVIGECFWFVVEVWFEVEDFGGFFDVLVDFVFVDVGDFECEVYVVGDCYVWV